MSDPQSATANDVDTLRAIAERHANHPEVTAHLYAAADYCDVLQRRQQQECGVTEIVEKQPIVSDSCPMKWAVHVQCVATGNDMKEETCGRPASESVEYHGVLHVVCPECEDELLNMGGRKLGETARETTER